MKISCLPVSIFSDILENRMSVGDWAKSAKEMGFDGIDISMLMIANHTSLYIKNLRGDLEDKQIPIVMATTYPDFTHPSALQRSREMEYLRRDIALCSELKVQYLRVVAGQAHPQTARPEGIRWATESLIKAAEVADAYHVKLLYENHAKPGVWEYYDFSYPTDVFLEILEGLRNTGIRVNYDTGNIVSYGDDPVVVLRDIYPMVETVHVSDMDAWGHFSPTSIGEGIVPNGEVFSMLKKNGYDGWICIEEASGNGLSGIQSALHFVKQAWRKA